MMMIQISEEIMKEIKMIKEVEIFVEPQIQLEKILNLMETKEEQIKAMYIQQHFKFLLLMMRADYIKRMPKKLIMTLMNIYKMQLGLDPMEIGL